MNGDPLDPPSLEATVIYVPMWDVWVAFDHEGTWLRENVSDEWVLVKDALEA